MIQDCIRLVCNWQVISFTLQLVSSTVYSPHSTCSSVRWAWWLNVWKNLFLLQDKTFFSWPFLSLPHYRVFLLIFLIVWTFQPLVTYIHWDRLALLVELDFVFYYQHPFVKQKITSTKIWIFLMIVSSYGDTKRYFELCLVLKRMDEDPTLFLS